MMLRIHRFYFQLAYPWLRVEVVVVRTYWKSLLDCLWHDDVVEAANDDPNPFDFLFDLTIPQEIDEVGEAEVQWEGLQ